MSDKELVLYREEDSIAWITLNRPEVLNTLNRELLLQLSSVFDMIKQNDQVRGAIITGAGEKSFSAGADIRCLNKFTPLEVREFAGLAVSVYRKIGNLGKVVIAAINGYALGGGLELAEACTLRIAARHAKMGHPEVRIGAVAGWGGTTRLPRLIGMGRAAELLLTGKTIPADEAYGMGLVNRVADQGALASEAESLLWEILSQAPVAVTLTWEAMQRGGNMTLEESLLLGVDYFGLAASTDDFREGTRAFIEKKTPLFKGR